MPHLSVLTHTQAIRWLYVFINRIKGMKNCFNARSNEVQDCKNSYDLQGILLGLIL